MKLASVAAVFEALNRENVRVIVVGGLAVNAHGYLRVTKDADLAIELVPENIERAFRALASVGYRPGVPVTAREFADPAVRESLIRDKEMKVLQFWSDAHRETPVDVFVIEPFDFPTEYAHAVLDQIEIPEHSRVEVRYVRLPTLIAMKEAVGRSRDLDDVQHLRWIQEEKEK
jgi:uncharacterized protein (DUF1786 family)